jgi:hypothetical protein
MPYYTITDFAAGLDLRRSSMTAPAGTLRSLVNAHITPGGEIEKRYAFTQVGTAPATSRGLAELGQKVYIFTPRGAIVPPTSEFTYGTYGLACDTLLDIWDYDKFDAKLYVSAAVGTADDPTGTAHFYDGVKVTPTPGAPANPYKYLKTYKSKMYGTAGTTLGCSNVGDPTSWTGTGSDENDLSLQDSDMTLTSALESYYDKLAIFSETAAQLWLMKSDPLQNQFVQTLRQAGTIAPMSVLQYGTGDILYLAPDGIRSLRARNSSLAASVSDVGSPLDPIIQDIFRTMGKAYLATAQAILQPVAGRFWIIIKDRVYVLSAFPGPKVTAWSEYQPGATIVDACVSNQRLWVRDSNHNIFVYGGTNPTQPAFDASPVEVVMPFLGGEKTETKKRYLGIDAIAEGQWKVAASFDPISGAEDDLGVINGPTQGIGRYAMLGYSTHISLRFRTVPGYAGPASISNITIHYELGDAE